MLLQPVSAHWTPASTVSSRSLLNWSSRFQILHALATCSVLWAARAHHPPRQCGAVLAALQARHGRQAVAKGLPDGSQGSSTDMIRSLNTSRRGGREPAAEQFPVPSATAAAAAAPPWALMGRVIKEETLWQSTKCGIDV